jgi:hypothetical protein
MCRNMQLKGEELESAINKKGQKYLLSLAAFIVEGMTYQIGGDSI